MKVDYLQLIKDSWNFTWKYKALWLFGFFLAIASGGGGGAFNIPDFSSDSYTGKSRDFSNFDSIINEPYFWGLMVLALLIIIGLSLLFWYLSTISETSITKAVVYDEEAQAEKIKIKPLWKEANGYVLKLFLLDIIIFLTALIFILPLVVILIILFSSPAAIFFVLLCCIGVPVLIVISTLIGWLLLTTRKLIILYNLGVRESLKQSLELVKSNLLEYFVFSITTFLLGILYMIPIVIVGFILVTLFLILAAIIAIMDSTLLVLIFLITVILVGLGIIGLMSAPYMVLIQSYSTKFILRIKR